MIAGLAAWRPRAVDDKPLVPSAVSASCQAGFVRGRSLRALAGAGRRAESRWTRFEHGCWRSGRSSRSLHRFLLAAASHSSSRSRPTTRQVSRPGRTMGCRTNRLAAEAALVPDTAAGDGVAVRASSLGGDVCRAGEFRPRGPRASRRSDAPRRRSGRHPSRLEDTLRRVERQMPSREWRACSRNTTCMERQLRDLREGVMRVRLVPVGEIFRRMPFVVRDLARDIGKRVHARDHRPEHGNRQVPHRTDDGSDPPSGSQRRQPRDRDRRSERVAAGKPPEGTIRLGASTVGESVVIEIADDGARDRPRCGRARVRRRRATSRTARWTPALLLDVICASGFSTRDEADRISGRGVGMAVVRTRSRNWAARLTWTRSPAAARRFAIDAAADAGDHRCDHRARRRPDFRRASVRGPAK